MKVFTCDTWGTQDSFSTEAGNFVGVAIGPESHESMVRVGPLLLQSSRVLLGMR